jgi:hypothetical protein
LGVVHVAIRQAEAALADHRDVVLGVLVVLRHQRQNGRGEVAPRRAELGDQAGDVLDRGDPARSAWIGAMPRPRSPASSMKLW